MTIDLEVHRALQSAQPGGALTFDEVASALWGDDDEDRDVGKLDAVLTFVYDPKPGETVRLPSQQKLEDALNDAVIAVGGKGVWMRGKAKMDTALVFAPTDDARITEADIAADPDRRNNERRNGDHEGSES